MSKQKSKEEFFAMVSAIAKFIESADAKAGDTPPPENNDRKEREKHANRQ